VVRYARRGSIPAGHGPPAASIPAHPERGRPAGPSRRPPGVGGRRHALGGNTARPGPLEERSLPAAAHDAGHCAGQRAAGGCRAAAVGSRRGRPVARLGRGAAGTGGCTGGNARAGRVAQRRTVAGRGRPGVEERRHSAARGGHRTVGQRRCAPVPHGPGRSTRQPLVAGAAYGGVAAAPALAAFHVARCGAAGNAGDQRGAPRS